MATIKSELPAYLAADPTLAGLIQGRVRWTKATRSWLRAAHLVLTLASRVEERQQAGRTGVRVDRVQVACVAEDAGALDAVAAAVTDRLAALADDGCPWPGEMGGIWIQDIEHAGGVDQLDGDVADVDRGPHRQVQDFLITWQEA